VAWSPSMAPATISRVPLSSVYTCREWWGRLSAQASQKDVSSVRLCGEPAGAVTGALGCENERPTVKVVDTTSDTTEDATPRNGGQPPAKKSDCLSRFCNTRQHPETGVGGLWLRRARVRVPSVTLLLQIKTSGSEQPNRLDDSDLAGWSASTCCDEPPLGSQQSVAYRTLKL
jgi:hypothetical protein